MVYHREPGFVQTALEKILRDQFHGDDYTIRLWEAEATLEKLGYVRGRDGKWRKKITAAEVSEMRKLRELAGAKRW